MLTAGGAARRRLVDELLAAGISLDVKHCNPLIEACQEARQYDRCAAPSRPHSVESRTRSSPCAGASVHAFCM